MKVIRKEYVISLGMFNVVMHTCLRNAYEDIVQEYGSKKCPIKDQGKQAQENRINDCKLELNCVN